MLENISWHLRWGWISLFFHCFCSIAAFITHCIVYSAMHFYIGDQGLFLFFPSIFPLFGLQWAWFWELQRAVLCWKHRFSWLCLDTFWEPGGWMLFTECYLQTCLNDSSLNSQLPWIYRFIARVLATNKLAEFVHILWSSRFFKCC